MPAVKRFRLSGHQGKNGLESGPGDISMRESPMPCRGISKCFAATIRQRCPLPSEIGRSGDRAIGRQDDACLLWVEAEWKRKIL